jgi:hypothetical protein
MRDLSHKRTPRNQRNMGFSDSDRMGRSSLPPAMLRDFTRVSSDGLNTGPSYHRRLFEHGKLKSVAKK